MREKFTITKADQDYMDSIGKSPKAVALKRKARRQHTVSHVKGRSHISGKTYSHE